MENFLFGAEDGPGRHPPLLPLDFEGDSKSSVGQRDFGGVTAEACSPVAGLGDIELSPDTAALQLSSCLLERTLPFLDIESKVLNDEILGTGHCSNCGGTPIQLTIAAITTPVNIKSKFCPTQGFPEKRKFSAF